MKSVLIIDDDRIERRLLYHALKDAYEVAEAGDGDQAMGALAERPADLVILDLHLPPCTETADGGLAVQQRLIDLDSLLPIVVVTGDQDRSAALEAIRRGVSDILYKPIDPEVLRVVAERAILRAALERELGDLRAQVRERYRFGSLVGESPAMRRLFAVLAKLAASKTSILLLGESGTGKSALARAIHCESPCSSGPFIVVDGAAIPETLLESELFGHVRGAYTGATAPKTGRIQMADGGTLFLDEIGNLSLGAQSKLLLFLDTGAYTPVGSNQEERVDVRLISATNMELDRLAQSSGFRPDLLYRIQGATVTIPPLRERKEDIAHLAQFLTAAVGKEAGRPEVRLADDAIALLEEYPWPGNVRQLKHVLESSLVLLDGNHLRSRDLVLPPLPAGRLSHAPAAEAGLPPAADTGRSLAVSPGNSGIGAADGFSERVAAFERELITRTLRETAGNKARAGRILGLDENQIRYLCRKHGIR